MAPIVSKSKNSLSFGLCFGLTGGPTHAVKLVKLLKASGYVQVPVERADIVITHSAGCWLVPNREAPQIIMYVGMPLSQTKPLHTWRQAMLNNYRKEMLQSLRILFISTYYFLRQPRHNINIIQMAKNARPVIFPVATSIFIANQYDPWPQGAYLQRYLSEQKWTFIGLPGSHDDIWKHPERYTAIIKHYAGLLAQTNH